MLQIIFKMILEEDQVKEIALSEVDEWIVPAREEAKILTMHFFGVNTTEYLTQISGLENDDQLKLRKDHAINNEWVTENLTRPIDNVWSARGGSITFDTKIKQSDINEKLKDERSGYTVKEYLKNIWQSHLFSDANGLLFVEVSEDGTQAYPTQKSIFDIKNTPNEGVKVEYVCFEPDEIEEENGKVKIAYLWLVDDVFYYRVELKGDGEERIANIINKIPNSFKEVPGFKNSPIVHPLTLSKVSPFKKQIDLLDNILLINSVKEIYQFLHGYPIFWMYANECTACDGTGANSNGDTCPKCGGAKHTAKKDVSDVLAFRPPTEQGQPVIAPNVAGYIQPDLETWREQRTEVEWKNGLLFYSAWGTTIESKENETATGRFIDVQPVNNKLNEFANIFEKVHTELLRLLGKFYYPNSFPGVSVSYGRRFLIESPDQVWEKYIDAKTKKAPISTLDQLLEQYYESEYQTNDFLREYYLKLVKVEPFVHCTNEVVQKMVIPEIDMQTKYYFSDWLKTKMMTEIVGVDNEKLRLDLLDYTNKRVETFNPENNGTGNQGE